ncbi:hypothetical protein BCR36DRAFT_348893 [Piromyces finnis]|uniref:F-box domain-containing protein n=1 Tax=Piromyces finnis TaxID=1754191 RepID=A0A1Y1VFY1_9FUNG|nr:hypothetical protein BCR36DRAFT_348893 [Piromyces finnis]|eukprot:ORX53861.1 hypothetical protein BCR36DRAFT_348893 [Piromyces finnis]
MDIIDDIETTDTLTLETSNFNILNNNVEINNEEVEKQNLMETTQFKNQNFVKSNNDNDTLENKDSNIDIDNDNDNLVSPSTFANLPSPSNPQSINLPIIINKKDEQNIKRKKENHLRKSLDELTYSRDQEKFIYYLYNLPNELLIQIAILLDLKSLGRMCQLSKFFCDLLYSTEELWENLNLSKKNTIGGGKYDNDYPIHDNLKFLLDNPERNRRFYSLKKIDLSITYISDLSIFERDEVLNCCSKLTRINLTSCKHIDSFSIYYLKKLPCLDTLDLCYCDQINNLSLKIIADYLPNLKHLDLSYLSNITEGGLRHLLKLPELETVKVLGCFQIRSYFWSYLGDFGNRGILPIRKLVIGEHGKSQFRLPKFCVWRMNDLVNHCPLLESLSLDMVLIDWTNNSLKTLINGCTKLKELSLLLYESAWDSFKDSAQELEKLEKLEITIHCGLSITEEAIEHICKPNVQCIRFIQKASIFDSNILLSKIHSKCKSIKSVEINGFNIKEDGVNYLSKLKDSLEELSLYEPFTNNNLLTVLSEMKLKDLNLSDIKKTSFSNHFKKLFRGNKIKRKPKMLLYDPIANAKQENTNFKNKIIKGKKNYNTIIHPVIQYEGTVLANNIIELELNSKEPFQDTDLQNIGLYCKSLRWISLSFPNTYPKTISSLINCPELVIVQLSVTQPQPIQRVDSDSDSNFDSDSELENNDNVHEVNRSLRVQNNEEEEEEEREEEENRRRRRHHHHRNNTNRDENVSLYRKKSKKSTKIIPIKYKASSPECQSLITFSHYGKKIRFLQLSGPIGLTDYTLSHISHLVSLNTFWIKECHDFTFDGLCKFSEMKWKTLKRFIITDCKNVEDDIQQKVHIIKDLEIDLIIENKD